MKKLISIYLFLFLLFPLFSQNDEYGVYYGVNISQFHTGSGHGSSYVFHSNIQKGRRSLDLGMIYQEADKRISGGDVKYKIFLGKNAFPETNEQHDGIHIRPYFHYNCIYQSSRVMTPDVSPTGRKKSAFPELPSSPGTIATMEHYAGIGFQVHISQHFCIDMSAGTGAYVGSLDKYNAPSTAGIHKENHGFVFSFEAGMGYKFGI